MKVAKKPKRVSKYRAVLATALDLSNADKRKFVERLRAQVIGADMPDRTTSKSKISKVSRRKSS